MPTITGALYFYSSDASLQYFNSWLISHCVFSILCSFFTFFFSSPTEIKCSAFLISYATLHSLVFTSVHQIRNHQSSAQLLIINCLLLMNSLINSLLDSRLGQYCSND